MGETGKSAKAIIIGLVLLVLLAAAIILLLLFINKFNAPNHERHLDSEDLHRLVQDPLTTNIRPLQYFVDLDLSARWHYEEVHHFTGDQKIVIHIGDTPTKHITLDSRGLNVGDIKIFNFTAPYHTLKPQPSKRDVEEQLKQVSIERWFLYPPTSRLIIVTSEHILPNSLLLLEMSFVGQILTQEQAPEESGLLKLQVADGFALATGGTTESQRSRRIFPCFDDTKFLSLFSLSVRHNSSFKPLSSTDLMSRQEFTKSSETTTLSIFKTTAPQTTSRLVLVLVAENDIILRKPTEHLQQEIYILKSAELNDSGMSEMLERITKVYREGLGDVSQKFVLFPRNEPGVSSRGLISISDPISEDAIYKAWLGDILRLKETNDTWIEEGFNIQKSDVEEDSDPLDEDFAYRKLNWNNEDIKGKDRSFIINKAKSILNFIDKDSFPLADVFKKLLKRRNEEDKNRDALLAYQQIKLDWYNKNEDEQRKELLEKWHRNGAVEFNSTTLEEFLTELDKDSKEHRKMITSWIGSSDYPVLNVEFLESPKSMKVKQNGFYYPQSKHTWEFPLELLKSGAIQHERINASEAYFFGLDSNELVVINPRRKVYGRVNYDGKHWIQLFSNLKTLPVYTDKVLINDLFSLAWNGHVQYDVVLDSLNQLRTADQWRAGKVLEKKIFQMDFALKDSSLWHSWKRFMSHLTGAIYDQSKEKLLDGLTKVACTHGLTTCLKDAHNLYEGDSSLLSVNMDLKEVALFEHGNKGNIEVKSISLEAALIGRSLTLLDEKLNEVLNKRYNKEAFLVLYVELTRNFNIQLKLWNWFKHNIRALQRIFTRGEVAKMFEATVENFHGKRNIDEAQHIWRVGGIYMDEIGHHRLQHKISTNYLWMERNEKTIQEWLLKHRF